MATSSCGYTSIFPATESGTPQALPLPLPWDPVYKKHWHHFLFELNRHIQSKSKYASNFVSIGMAGPTSSSTEMILPNGIGLSKYTPLQLPNLPPGYVTASGIDALSAWNCLLANNYGAASSYLNSNRAFVEEWAAAIDMYGEVFSGITLVSVPGTVRLDFIDATSVPGCAISGISLPRAASLLGPFQSAAGVRRTRDQAARPQDCAAETAVLAHPPSRRSAPMPGDSENACRLADP
jgi:hypothetical protein